MRLHSTTQAGHHAEVDRGGQQSGEDTSNTVVVEGGSAGPGGVLLGHPQEGPGGMHEAAEAIPHHMVLFCSVQPVVLSHVLSVSHSVSFRSFLRGTLLLLSLRKALVRV